MKYPSIARLINIVVVALLFVSASSYSQTVYTPDQRTTIVSCPDSMVWLHFIAKDFPNDVTGLQFSINYNTFQLERQPILPSYYNSNWDPISATIVNTQYESGGKVGFGFTSTNGSNFMNGDTLLSVLFKYIGPSTNTVIVPFYHMQFGSDPVPLDPYLQFGNGLEVTPDFTNGGWTFSDNIAPEIVCPPDQTLQSSTEPFVPTGIIANATDNCKILYINYGDDKGKTGTSLAVDTIEYSDGLEFGETTVTFTVHDYAQTTSTCSTVITLEEDLMGLFSVYPETKEYDCPTTNIFALPILTSNYENITTLEFNITWDANEVDLAYVGDFHPILTNSGQLDTNVLNSQMFFTYLNQNKPLIGDDTLFVLYFTNVTGSNGGASSVNVNNLLAVTGPPTTIVPSSTKAGSITFGDLSPPNVTCPKDSVVAASNFNCEGTYNYMVQITDNCDSMPTYTASPSGFIFPQGSTIVTITAKDAGNNTTNCSFEVIVEDQTGPFSLNCPNSVDRSADLNCLASYTWDPPSFADNCGTVTNVNATVSPTPIAADTFALGVTTVSYIATDNLNNTAECSFEIVVSDDTGPMVQNCPTDTLLMLDTMNCFIVYTWPDIIATDNCSGNNVVVNSTTQNGSSFGAGSSTDIVISVNDLAGNVTQCAFNVSVDGGTAYGITCPDSVRIELAPDTCQTAVFWTDPIIVDSCNTNPVLTDNGYMSGDTFAIGSYTVIYSITNSLKATASCSFLIEVIDTIPPVLLGCPNDTIVSTTTFSCLSVYSPDSIPEFEDYCSPILNITNDIPTDPLGIGNYTITYTAADLSGNEATCSYNVEVRDDIPPVTTNCPMTNTILLPVGICDSVQTWTPPTWTDNCTPQDSLVLNHSGPDPGDRLPTGKHTVSYTAIDSSGNIGDCTFILNVLDTIPPVILEPCPDNAVLYADTNCVAIYAWDYPEASDDCTSAVDMMNNMQTEPSFLRGPTYMPGDYLITVVAQDNSCNIDTCSFTVYVHDTFPLSVICPTPITVRVDGSIVADSMGIIDTISQTMFCDSVYLRAFMPDAIDNCVIPGVQTTNFDYNPKNDIFPTGTFEFNYHFEDFGGSKDSCLLVINVLDLPDIEGFSDPTVGCPGEELTLSVTDLPGYTTTWTGPNSYTDTGNPVMVADLDSMKVGIYNALAVNKLCTLMVDIPVTLAFDSIEANIDYGDVFPGDSIVINILSNDIVQDSFVTIDVISAPKFGTSNVFGDSIEYYSILDNTIKIDSFQYKICSNVCGMVCDSNWVYINYLIDTITNNCVVPNIITPNNDFYNDVLEIPCLSTGFYPNAEMIIYNQWGDRVFYALPYDNDWQGNYDGQSDEPLPDGTYYYLFRLKPGDSPTKGFITIFR